MNDQLLEKHRIHCQRLLSEEHDPFVSDTLMLNLSYRDALKDTADSRYAWLMQWNVNMALYKQLETERAEHQRTRDKLRLANRVDIITRAVPLLVGAIGFAFIILYVLAMIGG